VQDELISRPIRPDYPVNQGLPDRTKCPKIDVRVSLAVSKLSDIEISTVTKRNLELLSHRTVKYILPESLLFQLALSDGSLSQGMMMLLTSFTFVPKCSGCDYACETSEIGLVNKVDFLCWLHLDRPKRRETAGSFYLFVQAHS
jgi:hypothetical protein